MKIIKDTSSSRSVSWAWIVEIARRAFQFLQTCQCCRRPLHASATKGKIAWIELIASRWYCDRVSNDVMMCSNPSIKALKKCYQEGVVSKEDFAAALRAHHAAVDAAKSPQREAAANAMVCRRKQWSKSWRVSMRKVFHLERHSHWLLWVILADKNHLSFFGQLDQTTRNYLLRYKNKKGHKWFQCQIILSLTYSQQWTLKIELWWRWIIETTVVERKS